MTRVMCVLCNSNVVQIQHVTVRMADKGESWDDDITVSTAGDARVSDGTLARKPTLTPKAPTQNDKDSDVSSKVVFNVPRTIEAFVETEEEVSGTSLIVIACK